MTTSKLSRFYGATVPPLAAKLRDEQLTYATAARLDLVSAHLKPNFTPFGALDKTLAGFMILDDTGDDYTLLDLAAKRGQVYYLDHDTQSLTVRWPDLATYATWKQTAARAAQQADRSPPIPRAIKPTHVLEPRTSSSWRRLRPFVWLLTRSRHVDDEEAVSTAVELLREACGDRFERFRAAYARDQPQLGKRPHVAIYWLLHFTIVGDDARRAEVVKAVASSAVPLVRAFVATFGAMQPTDALPVLPSWRKRRSRLLFALARDLGPDPFTLYLRAFEIDGLDRGLEKATTLWSHAKSPTAIARVRAVVDDKRLTGPGASYLRAKLAVLDGKPRRGAKAPAARTAADDSTPLLAALDAAVAAAAKRSRTLADTNKGLAPALSNLRKAAPAQRELVSRRIIHAHQNYPDAAVAAACELLRPTLRRDSALAAKVVHAIMNMAGYAVVEQIAARARKRERDALTLMWAVIAFDERQCDEHHAEQAKELALRAMGSALLAPPYLDRWLALLGTKGHERLTWISYAHQLSRWDKASILGKLTPANALTVVRALLALPPLSTNSDPPGAAVAKLFTPSLHTKLLATLTAPKDKRRLARYAKLLEDADRSDAAAAARAAAR